MSVLMWAIVGIVLTYLAQLATGQEGSSGRLIGHSEAFVRDTTVVTPHLVLEGIPNYADREPLYANNELDCAVMCAATQVRMRRA